MVTHSKPLPIEIPPGVVKTLSENAAKGRYTDSNKVRFNKGQPEKWLGWEKFIDDQLVGKVRSGVSWDNAFGNTNVAWGSNLKLYVVKAGGTLEDITPIRSDVTLGSNPFTVTSGSPIVTVTHATHGAEVGDFVTFTGAAAVGGITIDGEYQITIKTSSNAYTITHSSNATSSASGGGASVDAEYQLNTGPESAVEGLGWGSGLWGDGTWGSERAEGLTLDFHTWSVNEYGNELLASPRGGSLYLWEEATDVRGEAVVNAPSSINAMFVTGERYVFALGTTTKMTVQWPDVDDITDWTPSSANTANSRTLQSGSELMGGTSASDGISLVWSDTSAYVFQYTGSSFVYDARLAGSDCGLVGPQAFVEVSGRVYWMGAHGFHVYVGGVTDIPNVADIQEWVFDNVNRDQIKKVWCVYDEKNSQVRWGFPFGASVEPDYYVDVSLEDFNWTVGLLDRTAGALYRVGGSQLLMVSSDSYIYEHDVGLNADGAALESSITYGRYALSKGGILVDVMGVFPDLERQAKDLTFKINTFEQANSKTALDTVSLIISELEDIDDCRLEGRYFSMKIISNVINGDFRCGIHRLEVGTTGARR